MSFGDNEHRLLIGKTETGGSATVALSFNERTWTSEVLPDNAHTS